MSLRDWPIRQKLTAMLVLSSGLVLLLTSAALVGYQYWSFRQTMRSTLSVRGSILATNSTASLAFANDADARELLSDRKSTRLNSSHSQISHAVFCLNKKRTTFSSSPHIQSTYSDQA